MDLLQYAPMSPLLITIIALAFILLGIFSVLYYKAEAKHNTKAAENITFVLFISFFIIIPLLLIASCVDTAPQKQLKAKFVTDIKAETGYTISKDSADQILDQYNSKDSGSIMTTGKDGDVVALTYIVDNKKLNLFLAGKSLLKAESK